MAPVEPMRHRLVFVFAMIFLLGFVGRSAAAPVVFTIDNSQSQITLSGKVAGTTVQEQAPGSLSTHFAGTIRAEVSPSTIQFPGGSVIDALTNGIWEPNVGGGGGSAPADFGGKAVSLFATVKGAFRNILLDVTSGTLPLTNGTFGFPAGSSAALDYDLVIAKSSLALTGLATNKVTTAAMLSNQGGVQQLVIQVDTEYKFKALTSNDSSVRFVGQLVATGVSSPVISVVKFADKKFSFAVEGASPNAELQSSTDLKTWQPRPADRTVEGNKLIFVAEQSAAAEFFRVKN